MRRKQPDWESPEGFSFWVWRVPPGRNEVRDIECLEVGLGTEVPS
jgi:hypothetical protein